MPRTAQWFSMALEMFHRARTALRSDPPSAIVATGPQFHTFIGAYFLSRLFDVPLVLDYRDEWTLRPRFPWVSVLRDDHRWEARCLTRATRVLFVTAALRTVYLRRFPQLRNRCAVVPNGWDPRDFGQAIVRDSDARTLRLLRIGYFGFMGDHQQPRMFLRSLGRLIAADRIRKSAVRLRIVGIVDGSPYEELASFEYPSVLEPFGWMSRRRAARMMCRCSALLIFNDPLMDRALPTKLYDYLATGRPIVVYGDARSEMKRLIETLGAGMTVAQGDDAALSRALEHVRAAPATRWRTAKRLDFLRQHTRDVTSGLMLGEIEAAMRTHAAQRRSGV